MFTVNELFSGIGTQALALEYLGIPFKVVGTSEIEKNAINVYNILHGDTRNYGDISKIDSLDYADLWTYSFPCFTGDTPVLTDNGYKAIKDIKVDDMVYSHTGNLQRVLRTFDNGVHRITKVTIDGVGEIETTYNHRFLVIQDGLLQWVPCVCIEEGSYACILKRDIEGITKEETPYDLRHTHAAKEYKDLYVFRKILSVEEQDYEARVYDIEVDYDHSFVAKGVVVHNCQDLSSGGKGKGVSAVDEYGNPVATRSGLLWQVERLLAHSCGYDIVNGSLVKNESYGVEPPKYLLLENVPELARVKKHKIHFDKWLRRLDELGYTTYYSFLNSKDFGVPQNRERIFCVSIRKDVFDGDFGFPNSESEFCPPVHRRLEDFVDKSVLDYSGPLMIDPSISNYLLPAYTRDIEAISKSKKDIWTCECQSGFQDHRVGIKFAPTIRHQNQHTAIFVNNQIHKLTGCESWKFMGIKEKDYWRAKNESGLSDNILAGLAGNAIVVPVLMSIFHQLWLIEEGKEPYEPMFTPFLTVDIKN